MPTRTPPTPAASPELLATLLGPHQPSAPVPNITINVAAGASLTFVVGQQPPARNLAE